MSACTPTVSLHDGGRLKCNAMGSFSVKISPALHYRIEVPALQSAAVFLVLCTAVSFMTDWSLNVLPGSCYLSLSLTVSPSRTQLQHWLLQVRLRWGKCESKLHTHIANSTKWKWTLSSFIHHNCICMQRRKVFLHRFYALYRIDHVWMHIIACKMLLKFL